MRLLITLALSVHAMFGFLGIQLDIALCKSSFWTTTCGLFLCYYFTNISNGHALMNENSLIKDVCTPSMKCVMTIVSTNLTHLEGRYCSFNNIKNSWRASLWLLMLITKFHLGHQSTRAIQNILDLYVCIRFGKTSYTHPNIVHAY